MLFFRFFSGSVFASCYSQSEARAEQILRIHSELMVIGLNCQHRANLVDPYRDYQNFTARFLHIIQNNENMLQTYFLRQGNNNPSRSVHDLRTNIANKISTDAAARPDGFCAVYGPRLAFARRIGQRELLQWAMKYPVSKPLCGQY